MKTPVLKVQLTAELRRYLKDQVRAGRYQDEDNGIEMTTPAVFLARLREGLH